MDFKTRYQYNPKTDLLGRGGFATVYKAHDTLLNRVVALKFYTKVGGDNKHTLIQEISRAIPLEHPNLCRYFDAAVLESVDIHGEVETTEVGIMEFIDNGELKQFILKNPSYLDKLLTDVLHGLGYLHSRGMIHRDLKPQNILIKSSLEGPIAKITDFGISRNVSSSGATSSSQLMGTVEYMAPEQFSPAKYGINGRISTNLDLWSYGLMVYELLTGETMFGSRGGQSSAEQVMSNILNENWVEEKISKLPAKYFLLVSRCLIKDAKARVQKAEELIALLNDNIATTIQSNDYHAPETVILTRFSENDINNLDNKLNKPTEIINPVQDNKEIKQEKAKKNRKFPVIITIIIIIGISTGGYFLYLNYNKKQGVGDCSLAIQRFGDTTTKLLPCIIKMADAGNHFASLKLAIYYYDNAKYDQALNTLKPLIIKNDTDALHLVGKCEYEKGMVFYKQANFTTALQWFNKGAASGNEKSQCMVGTMYFQGQGVEKNTSEALKWYLKAADKKNEVAMYAVGLFYADGIGVLKNTAEAKKYLGWVVNNGADEGVKKAAKDKIAGL